MVGTPACDASLRHHQHGAHPAEVVARHVAEERVAAGPVEAELGATRLVKNPTAANPPGPRDFRVLWFPDREEEAAWVAARIATLLGTAYLEHDGTVRGLTPIAFAIVATDGQGRLSACHQ